MSFRPVIAQATTCVAGSGVIGREPELETISASSADVPTRKSDLAIASARAIFRAALLIACFSSTPATAQTQTSPSPPAYDIPAQSLSGALTRFAQISHIDIIYDDRLAGKLRSSRVIGTLPPSEALTDMLRGTGLSFHFTRANAVLIHAKGRDIAAPGYHADSASPLLVLDTMQVNTLPVVGGRRSGVFDAYARHVLGTIDRRLRPGAMADRRAFRTTLRLWVEPDGRVRQAELSPESGDPRLDRAMVSDITSLRFDSPPADLPQPIRVMIDAR